MQRRAGERPVVDRAVMDKLRVLVRMHMPNLTDALENGSLLQHVSAERMLERLEKKHGPASQGTRTHGRVLKWEQLRPSAAAITGGDWHNDGDDDKVAEAPLPSTILRLVRGPSDDSPPASAKRRAAATSDACGSASVAPRRLVVCAVPRGAAAGAGWPLVPRAAYTVTLRPGAPPSDVAAAAVRTAAAVAGSARAEGGAMDLFCIGAVDLVPDDEPRAQAKAAPAAAPASPAAADDAESPSKFNDILR